MFHRIGRFAHDHRWAVIGAWILAAIVLRITAPPWRDVARDSDLGELPKYTTTYQATRLNADAFPDDRTASQIVVAFVRANEPLTPADRQSALSFAGSLAELAELPLVGDVWTEKTPVIGNMLTSPGGHAVQVVARLSNDFMAVGNVQLIEQVERLVAEAREQAPEGLEIGVSGSAAIGGDLLRAMAESLRNTELTTIVAVAVTLGVIYRSLWLIIVPLGSIAVATLASIDLLALLAQWSETRGEVWPEFRVYSTTQIFIIVLMFGAGTDFCLFLIARYRELRAEGASQRDAVIEAVGRVGGAISASALTTIAGLVMMVFSQFGKFTYSGPAIAISLGVALAVCLTLAPALLSTQIIGRRVTDSGGEGVPTRAHRFWTALANIVTAKPGAVLAASLLAAAPFAWFGLDAPVTYDIFSELPRNSTSRHGTQLLLRHLPPGEIGPLTILARLPGEDFSSEEGRLKIAELSKRLFDVEGVEKVRSLYRPTGEPPGAVSLFSGRGISSLVAAGSPVAEETFVSHAPGIEGEVTRLTAVLSNKPFSPAAVQSVGQIERALEEMKSVPGSPWHDAQFEMLGVSSGVRDLKHVTIVDRQRIQWLVTAAVFTVILVLLRRPIICAYLIATVLVNYLVTLGIVRLVLNAIHGPEYPGLDWKAPIFLFVILVAVGQDYNIFLVTRVFEEQRRWGPLEGLRRGLVQTGGIITSCGIIMAATFGSMMTGSLPEMAEMGGALALGILLDTFVVRTILVPAFLAIIVRFGYDGHFDSLPDDRIASE
jgi:putative drug exporter of the RND superfamily